MIGGKDQDNYSMFIIRWIKNLWYKWKSERAYRKRLKELKKRDPFIYH